MSSDSLQEVFFQLSSDLCCSISMDGYFERVNPAWQKLLGWSASELMEQPWLTFVHPDEITSTKKIYQQLRKGEPRCLENRYSHKNGDYRLFSWKMLLNENGSIYVIGRQISDCEGERLAHWQVMQQQRIQLQEKEKQLKSLQTEFELRLTAEVQQRLQEILMGENISGEIGYTLTYEDLLRSMLEHLSLPREF